MKDLIWEYRYLILILISGGFYSLLEWNNVKSTVLKAIVTAKDLAKDKILSCGQAQENWVVNRVYDMLPQRVKLFIGKETLRYIIRYLYKQAMDLIDDGKLNNSYENKDNDSEEEKEE